MNPRAQVLAPLVLLLSGLTGCSSCEKDKPYVPYTIDPSATAPLGSTGPGSSDPPPVEVSDERFTPKAARRISGEAKSVQTAAGKLDAPERSVFELVLESDVTGDDKPEVVAWMKTSDGTAGELVHFASARDGGPLHPRTLVPLPADLTAGPGCKSSSDLRQVGPRTLEVTFVRVCSKEGDTSVTEWKAAVVPVRDPAVRLAFLIDQPSGADRLRLTLDGLDRDGDRFDDLLVTAQLEGKPKELDEPVPENVSVNLHYFDRPAGLSRDPHEPAASFRSLAKRLSGDARGSNRDRVLPASRAARRMHEMLCAEGGPRVRIGGAPLQCGATEALQQVVRAELDAALGLDDLLSAVGAFDRLQAQGANAKESDAARKRIEETVPRRDVDSYHLPFGPSNSGAVSWGALAFDDTGALMIRTDASVMRFDPKTRVAVPDPASGPVAPWKTRVESTDGSVALESVVDPCDGGLLHASLRRGGDSVSVPLPVDPISTRGCSGDQRSVEVRPVLWSDQGLLLIVIGTPVWIANDGSRARRVVPADGQGPAGGPKSPNGKSLAHASSLGVLVLGSDGKGALWRSASMAAGYDQLTGCTVSNGATAVACIDGSRTRVFLP